MKFTATFIFFGLLCVKVFGQNVPEGYLLQYQQNFSGTKALNDFRVDNPVKWGIFKAGSNFYLQCSAAKTIMHSPSNIGIITNRIFGDFILEADVMPIMDSTGTSEVCFYLGYRDSSKFYYVQLSNFSDSSTNGIFLVKDFEKSRLTRENERTVSWNRDKWHKIRLIRDIIKRTIVVYLDDASVPSMLIKDYELIMGSVGIGTYSGSARFDNIKIWAPTVLTEDELKEMY